MEVEVEVVKGEQVGDEEEPEGNGEMVKAEESSAPMRDEGEGEEVSSAPLPSAAVKAKRRPTRGKGGRSVKSEEVEEEEDVKDGLQEEEKVKAEVTVKGGPDDLSDEKESQWGITAFADGDAVEGDGDGDGDGDEDGGEWAVATSSVDSQLTYEQQRQANIRRNAEQMRLLQIPTLVPSIANTPLRRKRLPPEPRKKKASIPQRRSLRNQGLDPEGNLADVRPGEARYVPEVSEWIRPSRREGPVDMGEVLVQVRGSYDSKEEKEEEEDEEGEGDENGGGVKAEGVKEEGKEDKVDPIISSICHSFAELAPSPKVKGSSPALPALTPKRINALQHIGMTNKLTKKRCTTMAFHPASTLSRSILVSGDKGQPLPSYPHPHCSCALHPSRAHC